MGLLSLSLLSIVVGEELGISPQLASSVPPLLCQFLSQPHVRELLLRFSSVQSRGRERFVR